MKRITLYFLITILLFSCGEKYEPRETINISFEKFKINNSSVRAIEIINDSALVYAGSKGDIGIISGDKIIPIAAKITTDSIVPHFRSITYTNESVYALSIANPALLYQFKSNKIKLVYKEENEKVFYDSMKFFNQLNGIAIGDPTDGSLSILLTSDGGESWRKMASCSLPGVEDGEAAFAASNTNIAIIGENAWVVTGGKKARIFHTPDMGFSWRVYNTPIVQGKETTGIYSVAFYNEKQGIICGGNYLEKHTESANIAITNDGGKTWKTTSSSDSPKYISCVQYVPNTQGKELFAVSTNGIFYSANSGENWKKLSDESFYSIRLANKNTAWLSGNEIIAKMTLE